MECWRWSIYVCVGLHSSLAKDGFFDGTYDVLPFKLLTKYCIEVWARLDGSLTPLERFDSWKGQIRTLSESALSFFVPSLLTCYG